VNDDKAATEALVRELLEHLNYCGWGDRWERERSEDLRKRADAWAKAHPEPEPPQ
jgi:hypothetical protein